MLKACYCKLSQLFVSKLLDPPHSAIDYLIHGSLVPLREHFRLAKQLAKRFPRSASSHLGRNLAISIETDQSYDVLNGLLPSLRPPGEGEYVDELTEIQNMDSLSKRLLTHYIGYRVGKACPDRFLPFRYRIETV